MAGVLWVEESSKTSIRLLFRGAFSAKRFQGKRGGVTYNLWWGLLYLWRF